MSEALSPDSAGSKRSARIGGELIWVADAQPTFWEKVGQGVWEPGTLAALDRTLGPGWTFLDIGAWVGALSLYAAKRGARVIAVEADPAALDQLRRNLAANPELARRIEVVPRAAAPRAGPVRLAARRKPGDSMSSALLSGKVAWTVDAITPGQLAAMLGEPCRVFVKIDIEGGEYELLPALHPVFERHESVALVSFHPAILAEAGERRLEGRLKAALIPFEGWRAAAITPDGADERGRSPDAVLAASGVEAWLFSPP